MNTHPLDLFTALSADIQNADVFYGHTTPAYWNMVGPFGGVVAAIAMRSVLMHPKLLGEPISITANFAAAMSEGAFSVLTRPVRTNRSTQHWIIEINQTNAANESQLVLSATVVTAARRSTWGVNDLPMPQVVPASSLERAKRIAPITWIERYDMRPIVGGFPEKFDNSISDLSAEQASLTQIWLKDEPARALDFISLTALADVFFPRIWLRRLSPVPIGTVSMTVYFHASGAGLAQVGSDSVLGQARGQVFVDGFFDQSGALWSAQGHTLATTHQIVYYKE